MMNKDALFEKIDNALLQIDNYPMETKSGTKKIIEEYHNRAIKERNIIIREQLSFIDKTKETVLEEINAIVLKIMPKDNYDLFSEKERRIAFLRKTLPILDSNYNIIEELPITKIICSLKDRDHIDLDEVNLLLNSAIDFFLKTGVKLSINDFGYSMFTRKYMTVFYQENGSTEFDKIMKKTFENIYWECPKLITHLRLNLQYLVNKYQKELKQYCDSLQNEVLKDDEITEENYWDLYSSELQSLEAQKRRDSYLNLQLFLNEELCIEDYIPGSKGNENLHKTFFEGETSFCNLSNEEKINFYEKLNSLEKTVTEFENYLHFEKIIFDVINRYKQKEGFKGVFASKMKEILKEEKAREKLATYFEKNQKPSLFRRTKKKKNNLIKIEMNKKLENLAELYDNLEDAKMNEKILTKLDDGSTIKDIIHLINGSYTYLWTFFEQNGIIELENKRNEFYNFCFSPTNDFTKRITILSELDFARMIVEKYRLLNIYLEEESLSRENISSTKIKIQNLLKEYELLLGSIPFKSIEFIYRAKKI